MSELSPIAQPRDYQPHRQVLSTRLSTMTTSLSDLKPGDTVILRYSTPYIDDRIATVDRLTKTQIIVGTRRFRIGDGREIGRDCWAYYRIIPATPDQIAEVERRQQLKQDQERAYQLAVKVGNRARARSNAASAIPHLEAALAALNQNEPSDP